MTMQQDDAQQTFFQVMERVPSPVYFWAGMASILASLVLHQMGRKQDALFVGQWPPTFFILAVFYKQVRPSRES